VRDFEMWRVAVASVVIDYPMVSVRMLAGNLGFMLPPAGGIVLVCGRTVNLA
jgi:hypothetical protein